MRRRTSHHRGATLIEAIAAIVIASVALPSMLWAMQGAHASRVDPVLATRARWLAGEKLEDIIADRHSTTRGYTYVVSGNYPVEAGVSGFSNFSRSVAITESGVELSGAGTGYKSIAVTVGWTDGRGQARTLSLSTVLTSYTP